MLSVWQKKKKGGIDNLLAVMLAGETFLTAWPLTDVRSLLCVRSQVAYGIDDKVAKRLGNEEMADLEG